MGTLNGDPMDIIDVSLEEVTNPSLIPAAKLGPQIIHGVSLPGLGKLQPSDFAAIASMDTVTSVTDVPADTKRYVYIESLPLEVLIRKNRILLNTQPACQTVPSRATCTSRGRGAVARDRQPV
jgi:hypothetical protein